jgi:phage tail sheath protein FI
MPLFVTSTSQAKRHGVYAFERTPPATIRADGVSTAALVEQFPWGPESLTLVESPKHFIDTFAPYGSSHTGPGYLAWAGKSWPFLKIQRVLGPTAAAATVTINKSGPTALIVVHAKYKGVLGNSLTATVGPATDGDANHFNLTVTLTGQSGTTTDVFENLNYSGTGADSTPDFTKTMLVGNIVKSSAGVALTGTTSFTGGSDGTVTSAEYVGTQGAADKGAAKLETDKSIDFVFTADPGNSIRDAVNTGLVAHADFMADRMAFINGNSGQTLSDVTTDVATFRSIRACYIDVWAYMRDDVDGTERLTAPAPWAVSVASSLSPSTSFAWKSSKVQAFLRNITRLETARGDGAATNTTNGVCTLIQEENGGFTFEAAVNTNAPNNPAKRTYKRTRMGHYIAKAVIAALREYVDSPNVPANQMDEVAAVKEFGEQLVQNGKTDPNNLPHLAAFGIDDLKAFNTTTTLAAGEFWIPCSARVSSDQEKIFLALNFGETVTVEADL